VALYSKLFSSDFLAKTADLSALWEQFRDLFDTKARQAKKDIQSHIKSDDPKKWDRFVDNATNSTGFLRQLKKSQVPKKDILHATNMAALHTSPVVGEVDSDSSSGMRYQIKKLPDGLGCTCNDWRYKGSVNPGYECKHIKAFSLGKTKVSSFSEMTSAFFDELQRIRNEKRKEVYAGRREDYANSARPYSDLLLPGETMYYNPRPVNAVEDPEVILGGSFVK